MCSSIYSKCCRLFQWKTRTGVPELRGPALVCLSAIDKKSAKHNSVLVGLPRVGQNPVLANIHSILAYDQE